MLTPQDISGYICRNFCSNIVVREVADGMAIGLPFRNNEGDNIGVYLTKSQDGYILDDNGEFLPDLISKGIEVSKGTRKELLNFILNQASLSFDPDTFVIKTSSFDEKEIPSRILQVISALSRIQDLEALSRENVRSSFIDDVEEQMLTTYGKEIRIDREKREIPEHRDFLADILLYPYNSEKVGAVFCINNNEKLVEAELCYSRLDSESETKVHVFGMVEDNELANLSKRKFQRAQNAGLIMPIFRGDEVEAVNRIRKELRK